MLLSVFSIPSPPPIGTTVGELVAVMNRLAPLSSATQVSKVMGGSLSSAAPASLVTQIGFKSTATLIIGAVTSTHS